MRTPIRLAALTLVLLLLFSLANLAAAQSERPDAPAEDPGRGFSYNGYVEFNGEPLTGYTDFRFSLWDAGAGGSQIGGFQETSMPVTKGRFYAILNKENEFDVPFIGEARWLEIALRYPAGFGEYTTLTPRQKLTPTPYAIGLVPGAEIVGTSDTSYALFVNYTTSSYGGIYSKGTQFGLYGYSAYQIGVYGDGGIKGVRGIGFSSGGIGVHGTANNGNAVGVYGDSASNTGVYGSGGEIGVWGAASGTDDVGVFGAADAAGSVGVWGASAANTGVYGSGGTRGVWGVTTNANATGVYGEANNFGAIGVWGHSYENTAVYGDSWNGIAVWGESTNNHGVYGRTYDLAKYGVFATSPYRGLWAETTGVSSNRAAVVGDNFNSSTGWAGYFFGDVNATGTISRPASGFTIDHPLDPANRSLSHAAVESPEMKTIYDGVAVTDDRGTAVVQMPDYFQALNQEFRYQLTVIGVFAQAIVSEEIANNQFTIMTDQPNVKVSWQVTGVRHDAYTAWQPLVVEQNKPEDQIGKYWQPQAYGFAPEMGIDYFSPDKPQAVTAAAGAHPLLPDASLPILQDEPQSIR